MPPPIERPKCLHTRFLAHAHVQRHVDENDVTKLYTIEVQARCQDCQAVGKFHAPNVSFDLSGLTISKDQRKLACELKFEEVKP